MTARKKSPLGTPGLAKIVAERAGVSLMTVSRVFNGSPRVSTSTRLRVLEAAEDVGYEPNSAARALRRGSSNTIGFLVASYMGLRGEYHSETLAALEEILSHKGYTLALMVPSDDEGTVGMIRRLVASNSCRGLIVRFDLFPEEDLQLLKDVRAPIIFASSAPQWQDGEWPFSSVSYDSESGIIQAVRHLVSLGHRDIAYLGGNPGWIDSIQRERGFRKGMQKMGLEVKEEWVKACDFGNGFEQGTEAMDAVFASHLKGPTAVICATDHFAAGAMASARRWGRDIPEEFSVVGFDDNAWSRYLCPPLTTIRHAGYPLGRRLGEMMLHQAEDKNYEYNHEVLDTSLVVRESTGRAASLVT